MLTQAPDEKQLRDFTKLLKHQYEVDPAFIGVHPHAKTVGGVYEFEIAFRPNETRRCYYWRFVPEVAGGQLAMDVADDPSMTPQQVIDQWVATRKKAAKARG